MSVTMLLADAVQAAEGKINLLGGGWSVTGSPTAPMGIAIKVDVPWHRSDMPLNWQLTLIDEDGRPAPGEAPLALSGEITVPRADMLPAGSSTDLPMVFQFPPLPLRPGRYEWRFDIDGMTGQVAFWVR